MTPLPGDELNDGAHERRAVRQLAGVVADVHDEHLVRALVGRPEREVAEHLEDEARPSGAGAPNDLHALGLGLVRERAHQLNLGAVVAPEARELVAGHVDAREPFDPGDRGEDPLRGDPPEHHACGFGS